MLACTALVGCNNENETEVDNPILDGGKAYMSVQIALPSNGFSSRGDNTADGDYSVGSDVEHAISSIQFVFYNGDGTFNTLGELLTNVSDANQTGVVNVEAIANAVVALKSGETFPSQVVAYVNIPDAKNIFNNTSLTDAYKKVADLTNGTVDATEGKFMMTSSTYYNNKVITATPVEVTDFYETEALAKNSTNPVEIYVERLAAKVSITDKASNTAGAIEDVKDRVGNTLKFKVTGFALNGKNTKSYYLKNIDNYNFTTGTSGNWNIAWNNVNDYRCFWATDPNYDNASGLKYFSYNDIVGSATTAPSNKVEYCLENTLTVATYETNKAAATNVTIVGQYDLYDKDGNQLEWEDFYYYNDQIWQENELIEEMADKSKYVYKDANGNLLEASNYQLKRVGESGDDVTLGVKDGVTVYVKTNDGSYAASDLATVNTALASLVGSADKYDQRTAHFDVAIEHFGKDGFDGQVGVVRNHWYEFSFNSIKNLGEGNYDVGEEIIPSHEETTYYVGARLNILSWKKVTQNAEL